MSDTGSSKPDGSSPTDEKKVEMKEKLTVSFSFGHVVKSAAVLMLPAAFLFFAVYFAIRIGNIPLDLYFQDRAKPTNEVFVLQVPEGTEIDVDALVSDIKLKLDGDPGEHPVLWWWFREVILPLFIPVVFLLVLGVLGIVFINREIRWLVNTFYDFVEARPVVGQVIKWGRKAAEAIQGSEDGVSAFQDVSIVRADGNYFVAALNNQYETDYGIMYSALRLCSPLPTQSFHHFVHEHDIITAPVRMSAEEARQLAKTVERQNTAPLAAGMSVITSGGAVIPDDLKPFLDAAAKDYVVQNGLRDKYGPAQGGEEAPMDTTA